MVSVVIPVYNGGSSICRAIDSVLGQSFSDYEIIVVDDGSSDDTGEKVKGYGGQVTYISQDNAGASVARNTGIAAASGEWIAFLDADDEWHEDKLSRQMALLERNSELKWCASNFVQTSGGRSSARIKIESLREVLGGRDYVEDFFFQASKNRCHIGTPTVVVHKSVLEKVGGFEVGRKRGQDVDLWWRIVYECPKVGFIAEPLATVHFDVADERLAKRRFEDKRGAEGRSLIKKHLKLAAEKGKLEEFRPFAKRILFNRLLITFYHGFKEDARAIVKEFSEFFPFYVRVGAYVLTVFPKLTSSVLQGVAYVRYKLGLEKGVNRRWVYGKKT
ncbi:MAG: glycosyltransferase [Planctomycetes bacterium]|nr:glycosyltransferase [Planctomycetota bacterium]